ncbi:MAG: biotin--[acetyl-CoA-carboxylase] ligase [Candidatus Sericytochromatia bacterium]|nr:biotin--[acetyl-CoA-carboxylase] ligase [Candidatus Sericytochromatia bacterium]
MKHPDSFVFEVIDVGTTDSTNSHAKRLILAGAVPGIAVLAQAQTRGYGQQGRSWVSPPGAGMYLSALVKPLEIPTWLPLLTALAVTDALAALTPEVRIKWVNDIVARGKKLGGILVEQVRGIAICGIGLNLETPNSVEGAIGLAELSNVALTANELAARVLDALADRLDRCSRDGISSIAGPWLERCAHHGADVVIEGVGGCSVGLGPAGELCLELRDGNKRMFLSGSLRMANGTYCG